MTHKTSHRARHTPVFSFLLSSLGTLALQGNPALAADLPAFSAEDVFEMEYANDPQVSPDGARVAYVRSAMDIMTDRTTHRAVRARPIPRIALQSPRKF